MGFNLPPRLLGLLLGFIGFILTIVFFWILVDTLLFNASASRTEGEVVRIEWTEAQPNQSSVAHTVVKFKEGERAVEIRSGVGSSKPAFEVGDKVMVLYRPGKAEDGRIESFAEQYLPLIILFILGPVMLIIGTVLLFRGLGEDIAAAREILGQVDAKSLTRHQQALTTGTAVQARVTEVRIDQDTKVDGKSPWVIAAEYQDEGIGPKMTFKSEPIWFDPNQYYSVGDDVQVYYVAEAPSVYAVVLDRIPEGMGTNS